MAVNTFGTLQTVSDTGVVKEIINFNSQCSFQKNDQNDDNLISVQTSEDISYLPESNNTIRTDTLNRSTLNFIRDRKL